MKKILIIVLFVGNLMWGCYYDDTIPNDLNVWPVAQPADMDMDESKLLEMDSAIAAQSGQGIESVVILKDGNLVYEKYYFGTDRNTLFDLGGVSTVVSNLAVGRAIDLGLIKSVDDSIYKYLPHYAQEFEDFPLKKNITFEHLMSMKSGISWNELSGAFDGQLSDIDQMVVSDDWAGFVISRPLDATPGSRYAYNSAIPMLIGEVIENEYGEDIHSFLMNEVFNSLKITSSEVERVGDNLNVAWGVSLTTLDWAKLGYLYLEEGNWFGNQFVEKDYMLSSVAVQTNIDYYNDFGWMWWRYSDARNFLSVLSTNDVFFASGIGEQRLYVVPHLNLVVAITGKNTRADFDVPAPIFFRDYIIRSIQ